MGAGRRYHSPPSQLYRHGLVMAAGHRHSDPRNCSATTVVSGQSTVYVNGLLIAVENDQDTHGNGQLVSVSAGTVKINGKKVIVTTDQALADSAPHSPPLTYPSTGSPDVNFY
jgi:uncharacterized Zn-binding protein involved in type VI secretion